MSATSERKGPKRTSEDFVGVKRIPVRIGASRFLLTLSIVILVVLLVAAIVFVAPMPAKWSARHLGEDWVLLGNVGQSYGSVATILAAVALIGVSGSLFIQAQEIRSARVQATLDAQFELFRVAFEYPELQDVWSPRGDFASQEWRKAIYLNLIFRYFEAGFIHAAISKPELRRLLQDRFSLPGGRNYWRRARGSWATNATTRRRRNFVRIAEEEWRAALKEWRVDSSTVEGEDALEGAPEPEVVGSRVRTSRLKSAARAVLLGIGAGLLVRSAMRRVRLR